MQVSMPSDFSAHGMPVIIEDALPLPEGVVYLDEAVPGVYWDAKYASSDNFTGAPVDGYGANRVACSKKLASALQKARDLAQSMGYKLLVWDAARPQRAVDRFVEWAQEPEDQRTQAEHYPNLKKTQLFKEGYIARRSGHTRGAAVDLTLLAEDGLPLDMGGGFDLMDDISHHGAKGLTKAQAKNRKTLKKLMEACGFSAYACEWWHYSLTSEPFPGEYFDFVISGEAARYPLPMPPGAAQTVDVAE
jgi:D-alanyl-D-alanine dipeptidase